MDAEIGTLTTERRQQLEEKVGEEKLPKVWELPDAPPGSTSESLLVFDGQGNPVRVAGPTHYHHLADGRVIGGYSGGTHFAEALLDEAGKVIGERLIRIVASHLG